MRRPRRPGPAPTPSRWRRAPGGFLAWVVIPAIAVLLLVAVLPDVSVTVRVALGWGESGEFTAERHSCTHSRNGAHCEWRGRYVGADGVQLEPVFLEGSPRGWQPGTTGPVIWLADRPTEVFRAGDPRPLLIVAGLSLVATGALLAWVVAVYCRVADRPTPGWISRFHRFCGWPPMTS